MRVVRRRLLAGAAGATVLRLAGTGGLVWSAAAGAAGVERLAGQALPARRDALAAALAERGGQAVLVNFWASWCPPCREEMPALARLAARWRARRLAVLTVAVADGGGAESFLWDIGVQLPLLHDPDQASARAWGAQALPTTVLLDRAHRMVLRIRGAYDWDGAETDRLLATRIG